MVITDHFSKFVKCFSLRDQKAETIAKKLENFVTTFGIPEKLLSDQGTNFQSTLVKEVLELLDIEQLRTSPYHPQTDGITERFNRTLKTMISAFGNENKDNWDSLLGKLSFAYNSAEHEATKFTPYEVMFGRSPRIPVDLIFKAEESSLDFVEPEFDFVTSYVKDLKVNLQNIFDINIKNREFKNRHGEIAVRSSL